MQTRADKEQSQRRKARVHTLLGLAVVAALLAWGGYMLPKHASQPPAAVFGVNLQKDEVLSRLIIDLLRSVEAEKSAVMAITDQESQEFADQTRQAIRAVEDGRRQLQPLLESDPQPDEFKLIQDFDRAWAELRQVDDQVLDLAVQNSNLKAMALAQGQARQAVDRFSQALEALMDQETASPQALALTRQAARAQAAAMRLYMGLIPHINEATEEGMDRLEAQMSLDEEALQAALGSLEGLCDEAGKPALEQARQAWQEFAGLKKDILALSRQNSNVRSLAISLGQKRKLAAQCQEILSSLQEAVRARGFKATR